MVRQRARANDIQYREGQIDGTFNAFYDDGSNCYQRHFAADICHGTATGWNREWQEDATKANMKMARKMELGPIGTRTAK